MGERGRGQGQARSGGERDGSKHGCHPSGLAKETGLQRASSRRICEPPVRGAAGTRSDASAFVLNAPNLT